jgi:predicted enzyme related to lactoylglutathione lyase
MRFEHFALNVADSRAAAAWYVEHLGFTIVRSVEQSPYTRFLADETGRTVVEIYSNQTATIPDYRNQHWLVVHFAVVSRDADADRARLEKAGATLATVDALPDGSRLVMMRDPWGVCVQLCQRATLMP